MEFKFLTVRDVAERLSVSLSVVYREVTARNLSCYRIGGAIRISEQQLADYLANAESNVVPAPAEFKHVRLLGG